MTDYFVVSDMNVSHISDFDFVGIKEIGRLPDGWGSVTNVKVVNGRVVVTGETGDTMILPLPSEKGETEAPPSDVPKP